MRTKKFTFGPKIGLNVNDLSVKLNSDKTAESDIKSIKNYGFTFSAGWKF